MDDSAAASHKASAGPVSSHMAKSSAAAASFHKDSIRDTFHKLPALGDFSSLPSGPGPAITSQKISTTTTMSSKASVSSTKQQQLLEEGIKGFYMILDGWSKDPYSFKCFTLNKENGETTTWTISPASDTKHLAILWNYSVVALGSTIYMIAGLCRPGFCPDGVIDICHLHAEVRFFNTLRPEEGWREAAPMHFARLKPAAVVVDGMIYVFGGSSLEAPEDGECFDPNTNQWHRFSAMGCQPAFASIQVPYVDSNGAKSILIHSEQNEETLYAYHLDTRKWDIFSHDFYNCRRPGAILDDIIYTVLDEEEQPLHGYHLIHKQWIPVKLPQLDTGTEICTKSVSVFASGRDKLCLLWYYIDVIGRGKGNKMECLELKMNKSYSYTGSGMMLNLTASKEFYTYFRLQNSSYRKLILAL